MLAGNAAAGAPAGTGNARDSMERTCAARLFDDAMQTFGFPGLAVAVQRRGVPLFVASDGPVHLNYSRKITPADRFQVSSTAKVFAGVLLGMLIDRGIALGITPTSNLTLGLYADYAAHPFEPLRQAGVTVSVNTDDPAPLRLSLEQEYANMADANGWDEETVRELARNSVRASFANDDLKADILEDIDAW